MDDKDMALVRVLQNEEIFLTPSPFKKAAVMLGWPVEEVLERTNRLKEAGVIRRFGAALTPKNAGFKSNAMVAWEAQGETQALAADVMSTHPRISHCYIRPVFDGFPYSVYTMIHAGSDEDLKGIIEDLSSETGITSYRVLSSLVEFKKSSPVYFPR